MGEELTECHLPQDHNSKGLVVSLGLYDVIQRTNLGEFKRYVEMFLNSIALRDDVSFVAIKSLSPKFGMQQQKDFKFGLFNQALHKASQGAQQQNNHTKWIFFEEESELKGLEISSLLVGSSPPLSSLVVESTWKGQLLRNALWLSIAFGAAIVITFYLQQDQANQQKKENHQEENEKEGADMIVDLEELIPSPSKERLFISPEVANASKCWVLVGFILFSCFVLDFQHTFAPMDKNFNLDYFAFVSFIFACFGSMWIVEAKVPEGRCGILNRDQTEEWRGWMQISFLLYHYFSAAPVYNLIRIFVACYVWMTGFGHFSYFWIRKDWSFIRFVKSLFRMNFLVIGIMLAMETDYVHYYICPMHTIFFFLVWGVTYPFREYHHTHPAVAWVKLALTFVGCALLWSNDRLFELVFGWVPFLYQDGSLWEWQFRSGLDRFATAFGMLFAFLYPNLEEFVFKIDKMKKKGTIIKSLLTILFSVILFCWFITLGTMEKYTYNALHPYTSFIPITCIIFIRNLFPTLRKYYLWGFSWVGKITLETYLLQFHLMLTNNNHQILNFFDGFPSLNFAFTWLFLLGMAHQAFKCTVVLSDFLFPYTLSSFEVLYRCGSLVVGAFLLLSFSFLWMTIQATSGVSPFVQWLCWLGVMVLVVQQTLLFVPNFLLRNKNSPF